MTKTVIYAIYNEDRILYLSSDYKKIEESEKIYREKSKTSEFYSLFSIEKQRVEFNLINSLIKDFAKKYINKTKQKFKLISLEEGIRFINNEEFYSELVNFRKKSKVVNKIKEIGVKVNQTYTKPIDYLTAVDELYLK